jgi:2-hydroxycyclohexanecarboxyl-CoA dehydrogenase
VASVVPAGATDGASVAVWDIDPAGAEETVTMINRMGGRAIACVGDASVQEAIAKSYARTREELGPVVILVNNAAITGLCPFEDITIEAFDRMISITCAGPSS